MASLCQFMRVTIFLMVSMALSACKHTVEMQFDLENPESFYTNGFPTDLRVLDNGKLDLSLFPRTDHPLTKLYVTETEARVKGYSVSMPIYLPFSGPLDLRNIPNQDTFFASEDSPIQLVDIDPFSEEYGRLFPLKVSMTWQKDRYRPKHLLQVLPTLGVNLKPNNTYALIVTNQIDVKPGYSLSQNPVLYKLLSQETIGGEITFKALHTFAPLRDWLHTTKIAAKDVVAATVWTTGDLTEQLFEAAQQVSKWPIPKHSELRLLQEFDDYCVIQTQWQVPGFQAGVMPFVYPVYGGAIQWGENNTPVVQYTRPAPLIVTIPKKPMPESGFPLLMYNHGTGGDAVQVFNRGKQSADGAIEAGGGPARIAAHRGWASSGLGGHLSLDHLGKLGTLDGYVAYNFLNPVAWLGNIQQMVLERVMLRRLLSQMQIPNSLCPEADSGTATTLKFDPDLQVVMGHSLGSYLTGIQAAIDPKPYQGAILSGAGGSWIEFAFGPTDPIHLQFTLELLALNLTPIEHLDIWHPIPMLAELLVGGANNILYTDYILREPTKRPPHVLVLQGHQDKQVPENIQRPLLTSIGVDLGGEDIGSPEANDVVFPHMQIGGAQQHSLPIGSNFSSKYGEHTAIAVRYPPDTETHLDGHYVTFQLDAPKHQYGCFLENIQEGKAPIILPGDEWDSPCY